MPKVNSEATSFLDEVNSRWHLTVARDGSVRVNRPHAGVRQSSQLPRIARTSILQKIELLNNSTKSSRQKSAEDLETLAESHLGGDARKILSEEALAKNTMKFASRFRQTTRMFGMDLPMKMERQLARYLDQYNAAKDKYRDSNGKFMTSFYRFRRDLAKRLMDNALVPNGFLEHSDHKFRLHLAIRTGDTETVRHTTDLCGILCDFTGTRLLNEYNPTGSPFLSVAARRGYNMIVEYMLENGAVVDAKDAHGMTPILVAAVNGQLNTVQRLFDHGGLLTGHDVEVIEQKFDSNMHGFKRRLYKIIEERWQLRMFKSAVKGSIQNVDFILTHNPVSRDLQVLNYIDEDAKESALHVAARTNNLTMFDTMYRALQASASDPIIWREIVRTHMELLDGDYLNVFMAAIAHGSLEVAKYIAGKQHTLRLVDSKTIDQFRERNQLGVLPFKIRQILLAAVHVELPVMEEHKSVSVDSNRIASTLFEESDQSTDTAKMYRDFRMRMKQDDINEKDLTQKRFRSNSAYQAQFMTMSFGQPRYQTNPMVMYVRGDVKKSAEVLNQKYQLAGSRDFNVERMHSRGSIFDVAEHGDKANKFIHERTRVRSDNLHEPSVRKEIDAGHRPNRSEIAREWMQFYYSLKLKQFEKRNPGANLGATSGASTRLKSLNYSFGSRPLPVAVID